MRLPLSWLSDYISVTDTPEALAERLSIAGLEVEEIITPDPITNVISAKITTIDPHPNADKLVITQCDDGSQTHQIVTGATNIAVNDIVPLALPGSHLANGLKIKKSKLSNHHRHHGHYQQSNKGTIIKLNRNNKMI